MSRALKRTVPYYTKNSWTLGAEPQVSRAAPAPATAPAKQPKREINAPKNWRTSNLPGWKKEMFALREKFPQGWRPVKKLSRAELLQIRQTRKVYPNMGIDELARQFQISPEAARRILRSNYRNAEDRELEGE